MLCGREEKEMGKKNKLIVYSSKKIVLSEKEKEMHEYRLTKHMEKYKRDSQCGGIDERGNYTRLHDRFESKY